MNDKIKQITVGKLPPQAIDVEEALLGKILIESNTFLSISDRIDENMFYTDAHQKIFRAIKNLFIASNPIDIISVSTELKSTGDLEIVGGMFYLMELSNKGVYGDNSVFQSKVISEKFIQRQLIRISSEAINEAYEDTTDAFELSDKIQSSVFDLVSINHNKEIKSINTLLNDSITDLEKPSIDGLTGVGCGFHSIDSITNGWQPSDLIIVAARPAMGKTAFVLGCARNAAIQFKTPTLVFSLEMSSLQLTNRLISAETGITQDRILKRTIYDNEIANIRSTTAELSKANLLIDDTASLSIMEFTAKARRMKQKHNVGLIIIDYLQLMTGKGEKSREQEISSISRNLKKVAKDLDIPIIALSQLSRGVETRADKRPMLSDLRESGAIEQDADMVIFLHRPEYYGLTTDAKGQSIIGLCEAIIAKNRKGITTVAKLDFNGSRMRFKDWRSQKEIDTDVFPKDSLSQINFIPEEEDIPF